MGAKIVFDYLFLKLKMVLYFYPFELSNGIFWYLVTKIQFEIANDVFPTFLANFTLKREISRVLYYKKNMYLWILIKNKI